nr:hypothetical protein 18 [bacterium]
MTNLPLTTESLDTIPEETQKFYTQGDEGKYQLNAAEMYAALSAKSKALDSERKIRSDFETKYNKTVKEYEGLDKDAYTKLLERQKEWDSEKEQREREALEAKGKYEEALEKTKSTHLKELETSKSDYQKQIDDLTKKLTETESSKQNYILNDKIRTAIVKAGVFAEDVDDVLTLTRQRFELDEKLNVTVKDENGNPVSDATLDKFFGETFKKSKPKFYQGGSASGSGTTPSSGGKPAGGDLSSVDKISQGLAKLK